MTASPANAHVVAPYWSAIDTRPQGQVRYRVVTGGESTAADEALESVSMVVRDQAGDTGFIGTWMLVASWEGVQEFHRVEDPVMSDLVRVDRSLHV